MIHKTKVAILMIIYLFGIQTACKKTQIEDIKPKSGLVINLEHHVAGQSLIFDSILYTNKAGQPYSISRLEYYLSDFKLLSGNQQIKIGGINYINAASSTSFNLQDIPPGQYTGIRFIIGVDSINNIPNGLAPTIENNNMFWPVQMGGGYHFMKLEGYYLDTMKAIGYAMHLGRNEQAVYLHFNQAFEIKNEWHQSYLDMDINNWFESPHTYNFKTDGRYSMSSASSMKKLSENGWNVFNFNFVE